MPCGAQPGAAYRPVGATSTVPGGDSAPSQDPGYRSRVSLVVWFPFLSLSVFLFSLLDVPRRRSVVVGLLGCISQTLISRRFDWHEAEYEN